MFLCICTRHSLNSRSVKIILFIICFFCLVAASKLPHILRTLRIAETVIVVVVIIVYTSIKILHLKSHSTRPKYLLKSIKLVLCVFIKCLFLILFLCCYYISVFFSLLFLPQTWASQLRFLRKTKKILTFVNLKLGRNVGEKHSLLFAIIAQKQTTTTSKIYGSTI